MYGWIYEDISHTVRGTFHGQDYNGLLITVYGGGGERYGD